MSKPTGPGPQIPGNVPPPPGGPGMAPPPPPPPGALGAKKPLLEF